MKIKHLLILLFSVLTNVYAQDLTDAIRFSRQDMMGTARFSSIGGAFSSLGGDLSSMKINPAGSSIFLTNHAGGTLNLSVKKNDVNYTDSFSSERETTFDLNQAGAVFVFVANEEDVTLSKYSFGINYDQVANFNDSYIANGSNNQSIDQFFLNDAQGVPLDLLIPQAGESIADLYLFLGETEGVSAQNAFLAYQTFLINPVDPENLNNTQYNSGVTANTFSQNYFIEEAGYNGKFSFNGSIELQKRFYFGLNLNVHYLEYDRFTSFVEDNSDTSSDINQVRFDNLLRTRSNGFSFQLGAIAKITDALRAALSYNSPTWYNVADTTSQFLRTDSFASGTSSIDPNILNIFQDYNFRTPSQWTAGLSYVFKKKGLLSIDYSIQDHSAARFTSNSLDFINPSIEENLTTTANLNIGGEYVLQQWRLRGGYFTQESPYKSDVVRGDIHGFSFGLGYVIDNVNLDLAYTRAEMNRNDILYNTDLSQTAIVDAINSSIFLTISFGF